MAYLIGSATNYKDFLAQVKTLATSEGWVTERWDTSNTDGEGNAIHEWLARGPGLSGVPTYSGTGDGTIDSFESTLAAPKEVWTIACSVAASNSGTFTVVGSVSGSQANATVGVAYDNGIISFTISDGAVDFLVGDTFTTLVDEQIHIGLITYQNVASDYYNLILSANSGYVSGNDHYSQPGTSGSMTVPMLNVAFDFWLIVNAQRLAFVIKVGAIYEHGYVGKYLPYGTSGQAPYPVVVCGMYPGKATVKPSSTDAHHATGFKGWHLFAGDYGGPPNSTTDPKNMLLRDNGGVWSTPVVWPWSIRGEWTEAAYANSPILNLRDIGGHRPLFECVIQTSSGGTGVVTNPVPTNTFGVLDGIRHVPGFGGLTSEDTVVDGNTFVCFQDAFRTDNNDYIAMELV